MVPNKSGMVKTFILRANGPAFGFFVDARTILGAAIKLQTRNRRRDYPDKRQ